MSQVLWLQYSYSLELFHDVSRNLELKYSVSNDGVRKDDASHLIVCKNFQV